MKKLTIGLLKAWWQCRQYRNMDESRRNTLRNERLQQFVTWAQKNSHYYARIYQTIGTDFQLNSLPPVNKVELMEHWNDWITDPEVTLSQVNEFMSDLDNIGRTMRDKYLVFTTSGSTGNPLVALCDRTTNNVMGAINAVRAYARKEDLFHFIKLGGKTIGVFATGGFYLGNSSVRTRLLKMPWKKRQMAVTSALLPVTDIVNQLNAFQPAMLGDIHRTWSC